MSGTTRSERRIVTVLFADLVGFTALSERLDAEDVALLQDGYFQGAADALVRHGGELEKFIGDAVVATFGVPRAGDDDAERAVRAGLEIVEVVARLEASLGLDPGTVRVRVGVNTGEVVVVHAADGQWRLTGDAVNTAARLQSAAEPGTVLVGAETALSAAHAFVTEPTGPLTLKGKAETVPAWRVVRAHSVPSREWALEGLHAATLGREAELEWLERAHLRAADQVSAVLVVAPPGVGKTRLVTEFRRRAAVAGRTVWATRVCREGAAGYEVVAELLRATLGPLAAAAAGGTRASLLERLARHGHTGPRAQLSVDHTLTLLSGDRLDADPVDLWTSWTAMLDATDGGGAAAGDAAPVWLVEDVHLASPDLRAFLMHSLAAPHRSGRLLLMTARPAAVDPGEADAVERAEVLHLEPLGWEHTVSLVHGLVGPDVLPPAVAETVARAAGGNPLFVEELLRSWAQAGALRRTAAGGWEFAGGPELHIPSTVRAIYLGQLDDLPAGPRTVVDSGSVPGTTFPSRALPVLGIDQPHRSLGFLTGSGLLTGPHSDQRYADTLDPGLAPDSYTYRHALLRDAAYGALPRSRRTLLHLRFAEWLEAGPTAEGVAEIIGQHLDAAYQEASALSVAVEDGLTREDLGARAATWLERAAEECLVSAPQRAVQLFRRAGELTPGPAGGDGVRRRVRLAEALRRSGHLEEALSAFSEVGKQAGAAGLDAPGLATAALGYEDALFESRLPRTEWGAAGIELLAAALAGCPAGAVRARLLGALSRAQVYGGSSADGVATGASALDEARQAGDDGALAYVLFCLRAGLGSPEQLSARLAGAEDLVAAARAAGDLEAELEGVRLQFVDLLEAGDVVAADGAQRRAEKAVAELRRPLFFWYPAMWRAMRALFAGDFEAAAGLIEHFRSEGERWHYRDADMVHAVQVLQLSSERGRPDLAMPALEAVAAAAPERFTGILAFCFARQGRRHDARRQLDLVAADGFSVLPHDQSRAYVLALCADTAALLGDAGAARELRPLLAPWAGQNIVLGSGAVCLGAASHFLGLAARTAGDPEGAAADLSAAVALNDAMAARPAATRSRLELARTLEALGRIDEAREVAGHAGLEARRLGMTGVIEEVDGLFRPAVIGGSR